jgi:hypothetical protein
MLNTKRVPAALLAACLYSPAANAIPVALEISLHAMLESTTSVFTTLRDYAVLNPDGISDGSGVVAVGDAIRWSGAFSSTGWTYSASGVFSGMALSMNYAGILSGSNAADVTVTVTGAGTLGNQPLSMGALSSWLYDSGAQDYLEMDFDQGIKIGANSRHGRIRGRAKTVCILDGKIVGDGSLPRVVAGAPIELVAVASSGKPSVRYPTANGYRFGLKECHLAPIELTSIASLGKRGFATVSTVAVSMLSSDGLPALAAPAAVVAGREFDPSNQGTVVAADGSLYADDSRNQFRSTGQYFDDLSFSGTLISVPEPTGMGLVATALALLAASRRRQTGSSK